MVLAVGIGAAAIGGVATASAAHSASKTAKNTAASNNELQGQIYNENEATLAPYVAAGNTATTAAQGLLGIGGNPGASAKAFQNWQNSTGFQSQLKTGQDATTAALGAKGLTDSGAALKALTRYGQQQALGSFQTYYGDLTGQQGVGLSAASAQAGVGTNYANAVSANNNASANAQENAALSSANALNSSLSSLATGYGLNQALGSSYGGGGSYLSSASMAPQYGFGPWNGFGP